MRISLRNTITALGGLARGKILATLSLKLLI